MAFSFSQAAIASLSFTGVSPATFPVHVRAALETVVGLSLLTLTISYVVNVYRLLQQQVALASMLEETVEPPPSWTSSPDRAPIVQADEDA